MSEQLQAINTMRKRLDKALQTYWSEMFALAYDNTWSAAHRANHIYAHGHKLISLCVQINLMKLSAGNHLHKAWTEAKEKHKEMRHCRDAKVVHPKIPDGDKQTVMQYFSKGVENKCNFMLLSIRATSETESQRLHWLHELQSTIECAIDLGLITDEQSHDAYQVMNEYWHGNYSTETFSFV
ncbi:MAG: hypothetical protein IJZ68_08005 [Bacteroidaceae bacterium]|nr:hypothetical protein [Bacteroidaceae bacterium]